MTHHHFPKIWHCYKIDCYHLCPWQANDFKTHTLPERPAMPRPTGDIEILDHMGPAAEAFAHFDHWLMNHLRGGGFYNPLSATDLAIPAFREELRDRAERRRVASTDFRRSIYERGQYVVPHSVTDFTGRVRESSPNWYRGNPAQTHRYTFTSMPCTEP